ncbi:MAG: SRPBCC family protein [Pseudomonadota bacterium]|nr:SRPBCC family protein [Pseudomonadota bacterium]
MSDVDDLGTFELQGDNADLRYERRYPRSIETVWAALIDPTRLEDWMGPARVEPHVSGRYELFTDRAQPMAGRILTWEPPTLLELSWNNVDAPASVVRYELTRDGDGTRLIFTHKGIRFARSGLMLPGWHVYLERLGSLLDGVAQPLSRPRYRELQTIYVDHYKLEGIMIDAPCSGD